LSEGRVLCGSHGQWHWIMAGAPGWPWSDLVRFNVICSTCWVGEPSLTRSNSGRVPCRIINAKWIQN
jgi:hypothetical protein